MISNTLRSVPRPILIIAAPLFVLNAQSGRADGGTCDD